MQDLDPEELSADQQTQDPIRPVLTRKQIAVILLGLAGVLVLVLLLNNRGGEEPDPIATATTRDLSGPTVVDEPGLQIPPLNGCSLISADDVSAALGLDFLVSLIQFGQAEGCVWRPADDDPSLTGLSVELAPGDPDDFEDGAALNGLPGTRVSDIGDYAVWFGGDGTGTLSAVQESNDLYLFMRLSIERRDVSDEERLALARGLMASAIETALFGPPQPIEVDLCALVTDEEAEALLAPHRSTRAAAFDPLFVIDNFPETVDLTQPGDFECSKLILTEIYVAVQTTAEGDFVEGGGLDGIPGVPVPGIGDDAVWFENVPFSSPFASPHEIDVLALAWGEMSFRVVLALPDLSGEEQFETAQRLARLALGRLPGALEVLIVEPDRPDLAKLGFVDNLLARQEAGDWTYEEGLIAILRLFAGETDDGQVLDEPELIDYSGTGIISLAQEYLETAGDEAARDEIARLLEFLIPTFPSSPTQASTDLFVALDGFFPANPTAQEDEEEDRGYRPPSDDVPFDYPAGPTGPGECASIEPTVAGWDISAYGIEGYGQWAAAVLFPVEGQEDGWNRGTHLLWTLEALTDSIDEYGTPPYCIRILLSHHGGSHTFVEQRIDPLQCVIFINKPMQSRGSGEFKQQLAADIAHCYFPGVFLNQIDVTYLNRRWWNHALAEHLSNVVYPSVNQEWRLSSAMAAQETARPLVERDAGNWIFFQFVHTTAGEQRVGEIIESLPGGNDPFLDELAVAGVTDMEELFHLFSQQMTDAAVQDSGGGAIPYQPPKVTKSISGPGSHQQDLSPFQAVRWEVSITPGQYVCFTGQMSDEALVSYREGRVGSAGGGWIDLPTTETAINDDFVVIATAVHDGSFSIDVRDVDEEPDCEDEEEAPPPPPPPAEPCLCDPSDYFLVFQDIPAILQELFSPGSSG